MYYRLARTVSDGPSVTVRRMYYRLALGVAEAVFDARDERVVERVRVIVREPVRVPVTVRVPLFVVEPLLLIVRVGVGARDALTGVARGDAVTAGLDDGGVESEGIETEADAVRVAAGVVVG